MKEQLWLTKVSYVWLSPNTSQSLVFCIDAHGCAISTVIGIYKEKEICLPSKEYISGQRWERINMVVKYIVHIHIYAKLRAYWLFVLLILCQLINVSCINVTNVMMVLLLPLLVSNIIMIQHHLCTVLYLTWLLWVRSYLAYIYNLVGTVL